MCTVTEGDTEEACGSPPTWLISLLFVNVSGRFCGRDLLLMASEKRARGHCYGAGKEREGDYRVLKDLYP